MQSVYGSVDRQVAYTWIWCRAVSGKVPLESVHSQRIERPWRDVLHVLQSSTRMLDSSEDSQLQDP